MRMRLQSIQRVIVLLGVCVAAAGAAGCSKAAPAKSAGFVDTRAMAHDPSLPFHRVWRKPGWDAHRYTKFYVAPVNTSYMLEITEWQQGMAKVDFERDVQALAVYTQNAIKKAFREDPHRRFQVVENPPTSPDALILEVALTEVVPSKVVLNALGYAPFGIGLAVNVVRGMAEDVSTTAFEGRVRAASTREVVAMVADREAEQKALVSVRGLTWYSHAHVIIDAWADQFVKVANRRPGEVVEDTKPLTLKPW